MSLQVIESFNHFTTQAQLISKGWVVAGTVTIETNQGRRGTGNLRTAGANTCRASRSIPVSHASGVIGIGFNQSNGFHDFGYEYLQIADQNSVVHLEMRLDAAFRMEFRRGPGGPVIATGITTINASTYYFLEMKFTINDTTGYIEVHLNGAPTPECAFSGDTRNGGLASWKTLTLWGQQLSATAPHIRWDDLYMLDGVDSTATHGQPNNDFLGDIRVDAYLASAGNGTNVGWTPGVGTDHGEMVNETTPNDDTGLDYNIGVNVGDKDTYNFPALGFVVPVTILGVQGVNRLKKSDAGARSICNVIRSGGADYDAPNKSLTTAYTYAVDMWESNPAGVATPWTQASVEAAEFGAKVTI